MFEKKFRSLIGSVYGIDYIHNLREDYKEKFLENKDLSSVKIDRKNAIRKIKEAKTSAKKRQRVIEGIAYFLGGPLAFILSKSWSDLWVISIITIIYGIIFPLEIGLRKTSIDILAYEGGKMTMRDDELKFRLAWNKGVLKSILSIALFPIVTFLMKMSPSAYKRGMGILGRWLREDRI